MTSTHTSNAVVDLGTGANRSLPKAQTRPGLIDAEVLLASLSSQVAILDRDGIIVSANGAWRTNVSARREGEPALLPGRSYVDECRRLENRGNDGAREVRQGIEAVLARQMTTFRSELPWPVEERWYHIVVDALKEEAGGVLLMRVDVTDQRRADARAEETRRHTAHLGRVAMMSEIASAFALEIKQPVTAIRLNALAGATLLNAPGVTYDGALSDSREAWQMFKDIYDDASRASSVIEHVHQHVRKQGAVSGVVDLGEICRSAALLLDQEAMLRSATMELDLEAGLSSIVGAQVEIQQMVMCLIVNALDAVASSPLDRRVIITTVAHGDAVELSVRDNGPGISPAVRQEIFESFVTTKEQGLGMGLIVARLIAERHRGRISAENARHPDHGALFRVLLPIS